MVLKALTMAVYAVNPKLSIPVNSTCEDQIELTNNLWLPWEPKQLVLLIPCIRICTWKNRYGTQTTIVGQNQPHSLHTSKWCRKNSMHDIMTSPNIQVSGAYPYEPPKILHSVASNQLNKNIRAGCLQILDCMVGEHTHTRTYIHTYIYLMCESVYTITVLLSCIPWKAKRILQCIGGLD
jgi:hypothetical protein